MPNQFSIAPGSTGGTSWWDQNDPHLTRPVGQGGTFGGAQNRYAVDTGTGRQSGAMQTQTVGADPTVGQPTSGMPGVYGSQTGALTGGGGPTPGNEQQWFMQLVGNRPWNQSTFNELAPTLQKYGFNITPPNAVGDQTKIQLPNGQWVRVGFGEGRPVWIPQNNAPGAGGAPGAGAAGDLNPQGGVNSPWAIPKPFQSPTLEEFQQEPGLQARYQMGLQGLERSAAAQGSLLSGGTQKGIARFGQDFATNEYNNSYNRAYTNYMTNFNVQSQTPWNRYTQVLDRGLSAAQSTQTRTPVTGS